MDRRRLPGLPGRRREMSAKQFGPSDCTLADTLGVLLDGSTMANAVMPWGTPGPIRLPDVSDQRLVLIEAHLRGMSAEVLYSPKARRPTVVRVDALALAGFCPGADGFCRWIAIDLDGPDHGETGIAGPPHAVRSVATFADHAGIAGGLLVARSRGGVGRHVFLIPPFPTAMADAVLVVAALVAGSYRAAKSDVAECGVAHAFVRADGTIATPGQSGALELIPQSASRPDLGWSITLPAAGAYACKRGGVIVDPFTDEPTELIVVPRCDPMHWARFVSDAKARWARRISALRAAPRRTRAFRRAEGEQVFSRIHPKTRDFIEGRAPQGQRARSAFPAACNWLAVGVPPQEVERLILAGAAACGLPAREARSAFSSALGAMRRRGRT